MLYSLIHAQNNFDYNYEKKAHENSQRPLFPQWSHHVYPQFLPGSHPNHQPPVVIQQQHHQHYHQQMQQQQHHLSNANNNYINTDHLSPILHNNHIINNNHQHLHQNFGQNLSNETQNTNYYQQQQHPFMQRASSNEGMMINNMTSSGAASGANGLSHIKTRNRLIKNNGLNNNFYRSSGINSLNVVYSHPLDFCFF